MSALESMSEIEDENHISLETNSAYWIPLHYLGTSKRQCL